MAGTEDTPRVIPGRWIVSLRSHASQAAKSNHLSLVSKRTADDTPFCCHVQKSFDLPEARAYSASFDDATKEEIEQMAEVAAVEPVQLYRHCAFQTQGNVPWGLARISKPNKLPSTGTYAYKYRDDAAGEGVMAYVLDTGINHLHNEFEGRAIRGPKFVTDPRQEFVTDDEDNQGHGTHCAGTIGSRAYGVAKNVTIVGVKVFNDLPDGDKYAGATNEDIMDALKYVVAQHKEHGKPSVVNLSLGGGISGALDNQVAATVRAGVVVCVAAGNGRPPQDAGKASPARVALAITVGATDINDQLADFSYFGKLIDVLAPGVNILSTWIGSKDAKEYLDGTSMACPHVAGVACCLLSDPKWEDKSPSNIVSQLLIAADKNKIGAITEKKLRTIDAVLQLHDS